MVDNARCIECGGDVVVSFPSSSEREEECLECSRRSHWRVCCSCGEVNGPRRVICLECGMPFDRRAGVRGPAIRHSVHSAAA
jgi:hypothetical protein